MREETTVVAGFESAKTPTAELGRLSGLDEAPTARVPDHIEGDVRPAQLAHIVLQTNRIDAMRVWWRAVLGGSSMFSSREMEFITFDDEHHRVAIFQRGPVKEKGPEPDTAGLHHAAFSYQSLGDLVATYKRLKPLGILPMRTIHHGPTVSNYYLDPDNNRVELQVDVFPTKAALNAWFATREFNRNPIGILFDFEELVRRLDAGETPEALLRPSAWAPAQPGS